MAGVLAVLVTDRYRRAAGLLAGMAAFLVTVALLVGIGVKAMSETVRATALSNLPEVVRLRSHAVDAFDILANTVTAPPCSDVYRRQVAAVAFLPDGLNEFLAVDGDAVVCSTTVERFEPPVPLRDPDFVDGQSAVAVWMDTPLDRFGLAGIRGALLRKSAFAIIVPPGLRPPVAPDWMALQYIVRSPDGRWWPLGGAPDLYRAEATDGLDWSGGLRDGPLLRALACDATGLDCIVAVGSVWRQLADLGPALFAGLIVAASVGWAVRSLTLHRLRTYWSFDARLARELGPRTVLCVYQPVLEMATGRVTGCEVLARWRDVDDQVVSPAVFLPAVERLGLTVRFTELVAARAFADLAALDFGKDRFRVAINVFPQDLRAGVLLPLLQPFLEAPDRFEVVVELVESAAIEVAAAVPEIARLHAAGVKIFIDDFGTGYFSVQTLVDLAVDGVKLDRVFASAPSGSLLARMMPLAVEMVHATGRPIVIEGVETAEQLEQLRALSLRVDYVQGYHIARPLPAAALEEMVAARCRPRAVAA